MVSSNWNFNINCRA